MTWCGVTSARDASLCVEAGADLVGLNFWAGTPRCVDLGRAQAIVRALPATVTPVAVFVDPTLDEVRRVREATGIAWVQLHGHEPPALLDALLPHAYKAVGVGEAPILSETRRYAGDRLLLDARVPGALPGGTGVAFDWRLATEVARERALILAGGLTPDNVAEAILVVRPFGVDVASGVEQAPGVKDPALVRRFVAAARAACGGAAG